MYPQQTKIHVFDKWQNSRFGNWRVYGAFLVHTKDNLPGTRFYVLYHTVKKPGNSRLYKFVAVTFP